MSKYLDDNSRSILEFRPDIQRIEPRVQPGLITPVSSPGTTLEKVEQNLDKMRRLAEAVNTLAAATQVRADLRAENIIIELDPLVDASTVLAMRRVYPTANPTRITYEQYRNCKENQRLKGETVGKQVLINAQEVKNNKLDGLAGYGTPAASNGSLRPELNQRANIIPPIDVLEVQDVLIKILVNFIWKNFIKPAIGSFGGPAVAMAMEAAPDEIVPLPEGFQVADITSMGVPVLGEKPPKFLTTEPPQVPKNVQAAQSQQDKEKQQ